MARRYAKHIERRRMEDIMLAESVPVKGDEKTRIWREGWSFQRVARTVANDLVQGHAKSTAHMLGIKIRDGEITPEDGELEDRVAILERKIEELADAIGHEFEKE